MHHSSGAVCFVFKSEGSFPKTQGSLADSTKQLVSKPQQGGCLHLSSAETIHLGHHAGSFDGGLRIQFRSL